MRHLQLFENYDNWYDHTVFMVDGKPQTFYHGTKEHNNFDRFKVGIKGLRGGMVGPSYDSESMGTFFTIDKEDASGYGVRVVEVNLKSSKPLFTDDEAIGSDEHWLKMPEARKKELVYIFETMIIKDGDNTIVDFGYEALPLQQEWIDDMTWLIRGNELGTSLLSEGGVCWHAMDLKVVNERMIECGYDSVKVYEPDHENCDYSQCILNSDNIKIIRN